MKRAICLLALLGSAGSAMPIKTQMIKSRAYFQPASGNLLEALDLKAKTLKFTKKDAEECGSKLMREAQTLRYSCTLDIPSSARITKLQNLVTGRQTEVVFGGTKRKVDVAVAADARSITFTTSFDATGIDFEISKFNDDFFRVYDKVAQLIIAEAQSRQPVRIEVLESR